MLGLFGLEVRKSNTPKFNTLGFYGIPYEEWEQRQKKYYLKRFNITVNDATSPLIAGYDMAKRIAVNGGGRFSYDANGALILSIQGVRFYINFTDELFVIHEVFVSGDYNFKTRDEVVVIDIGLNIGATALFFSRQENVRRVYAYELFEPTYLEAQRNLALNDATKITSLNVGLGKENKQLQLPYSITSKARMGLNGLPATEKFPDAKLVNVSLIDVAEEVVRINNLEPGVKKICKMDCEGAEFEILEQLFKKDVAHLIDFYIIEWHNRDTTDIENQFLRIGFDLTKSTFEDGQTGLIHAYKSKSS